MCNFICSSWEGKKSVVRNTLFLRCLQDKNVLRKLACVVFVDILYSAADSNLHLAVMTLFIELVRLIPHNESLDEGAGQIFIQILCSLR